MYGLPKPYANRPLRWWIAVVGLFAVVYSCSLTPAYTEGDDAASIAYHLFGRKPLIQVPYSAYQAMMDTVLAILPPQEAVLRTGGILITSIAMVGMVLLMLCLVFEWLNVQERNQRLVAAIILLLVSPEFFYLGLVY